MPEQTSIISFQKGARIYEEGAPAASFFIIREGSVKISKDIIALPEIDNKILGPGDFFAVESALTERKYRNCALAMSTVSLISVPKSQYEFLATNNRPIAMKILLEFSALARHLNDKLVAAQDVIQAASAHQPAASVTPSQKPAPAATQTYTQKDNLRIYPAGAVIFKEGDAGNELFIIQRGSVKITKQGVPDEIVLAILKAGAMFGEMGLLEQKPRSANAYADEPCVIAVIGKENYDQILVQPKIFLKLSILLADRVWMLCKQLTNSFIKNPVERVCDLIIINLERDGIGPTIVGQTLSTSYAKLMEMSGMPDNDWIDSITKLSQEGLIVLDADSVFVKNPAEIYRRNEIYWKLYRG